MHILQNIPSGIIWIIPTVKNTFFNPYNFLILSVILSLFSHSQIPIPPEMPQIIIGFIQSSVNNF